MKKGELYRDMDNPIIHYFNGDKLWYKGDKLHRLGGPAYEYSLGDREWWVEGKLHRLDGPAIEYWDGSKEWYYEDEWIDCASQEEFLEILNERGIVLLSENKDISCKQCGKSVCRNDASCWWCCCTNPGE